MLVHQRNRDEAPYIVEQVTGSNVLTWTITDTDTAYSGYGDAEIRITFTNGLAKSVVFRTLVVRSITADMTIPEPLQSWYDAMIDYIDEHSVSPEQIEQAVADYLDEHPVSAPVTSVNGLIGDVVLTASDVGAMPDTYTAPVSSVNGKTGSVVLTASDVNALPSSTSIPSKTSDLTNDSGFLASAVTSFNGQTGSVTYTAPVTKVNNKTGAVTLTASDVGALPNTTTIPTRTSQLTNDSGYITSAPVSSVDGKTGTVSVLPTGGTTGQVLTKTSNTNYAVQWSTVSGGGAVDSVNGQTGVVVLDADDVGALPDTTTIPSKTSDLTNDSGYITSAGAPVQSVNGQTGAVTVSVPVSSVNGRTGAVTGLAEAWTVQNMTSADTTVTLQTDKFYVFPEMSALTVTVTAVGMYAFRFTSGTTATVLTVTGATMPDSFTVEASKVYEVNVYQGYGVVSAWAAS